MRGDVMEEEQVVRLAKLSDIYKINGEPMISPMSADVTDDSLADDNSGRTDDGVLHVKFIIKSIRKVSFIMPPMTNAEIKDLASKVRDREYDLTFRDPVDGIVTSRVYTSTANYNLYSTCMYGGLWNQMTFNAIEIAGQ